MMTKLVTIILILGTFLCQAQVKRALNFVGEADYEKAQSTIEKGLRKDNSDAGLLFVYSVLLSRPDYLNYDLQQSYLTIISSIESYELLTMDSKVDLHENGVDSTAIFGQKQTLEALALNQARQFGTIEGYEDYIKFYQTSAFKDNAISSRDSIAFAKATSGSDLEAELQSFLDSYPNASQRSRAELMLDSISYSRVLREGSIEDIRKLLNSNISKEERVPLNDRLFDLMTIDNSPASYLEYLNAVPKGAFSDKAVDYLYHLHKNLHGPEEFLSRYPELNVSDSLRRIIELDQQICVPIYLEDGYGFLTQDGSIIAGTLKGELPDKYQCGSIKDDILVSSTPDSTWIIDRSGRTLYLGPYREVDELGGGLISLRSESSLQVLHKHGEILLEGEYIDVKFIMSSILALQAKEGWRLFNIHGLPLYDTTLDNVFELDRFILLEKKGLLSVETPSRIFDKYPDGFTPEFKYDSYELLDSGLLIVGKEDFEGLLDSDLDFVVPFAFQELIPITNGYLIESEGLLKAFLNDSSRSDSEWYEDILANNSWLAMRKRSMWSIVNLNTGSGTGFEYDSVNLLSDKIVAGLSDSSYFMLKNSTSIVLERDMVVKLLSAPAANNASQEFLFFRNRKEEIVIYNENGEKIFEDDLDEVAYPGGNYLVGQKQEKKGLINSEGKVVLDFDYTAIGRFENGAASLLQGRKFGLFIANNNTLIKPVFDQALERLNEEFFIGRKGQSWGLVNNQGETAIDFKYDQITKWTGRFVLAKEDGVWKFIDVYTQEEIGDPLKNFEILQENKEESIMKSYNTSGYGIFSSSKGYIIPESYTDITNIGTAETPIYIAEYYFSEADYYLVVYYDASGKIIRRQGLAPEEYDKIYCD